MREPHAREIVCLEPSALALRLKGQRHLTLLESVMRSEHLGRYSFQGGLAGYISYDYGRRLEPHARIPDFAPICPDLILHHYDCVAAFDHMQERAWIISETPERADEMEDLLRHRPKVPGGHAIEGWQSNFTRED